MEPHGHAALKERQGFAVSLERGERTRMSGEYHDGGAFQIPVLWLEQPQRVGDGRGVRAAAAPLQPLCSFR